MPEELIPHSRPTVLPDEAEAVGAVLSSAHPGCGPAVARFEAAVASLMGAKHAVAVSSGTAALHLVLAAMGIGPGDEVVIPSYVCVALYNCCRYVGAEAVLVDCRLSDFNMDPAAVAAALTPRTKAIVLPHMFGSPADVEAVASFGVPVIEDCAMSIGAVRSGRPVGSMGLAAVCSFHATKMISTGEGGMALTSDDALAGRMRDLAGYDAKDEWTLRFSYAMSDLQAAVGLCQIEALDSFIARRREIARYYDGRLGGLDITRPRAENPGEHVYYRYVLRVDRLDRAIERMGDRGVVCRRPVFKPIHRYLHIPDDRFPASAAAADTCLSLPIYPSLSDEQVERVAEAALSALG